MERRGASTSTWPGSSRPTTPRTPATAAFLAGPTRRTKALWHSLAPQLAQERARGIYDVDTHTPSTHHRARTRLHRPGPGTDRRPADRRAAQARDHAERRPADGRAGPGRLRLHRRSTGARRSSPATARPTTRPSSTPTPRRSRPPARSHIVTGLPDAYGRGRIIGDYRRLPLYGLDRAHPRRKRRTRPSLDDVPSTADVIRDREELAEQLARWRELGTMADVLRVRRVPARRPRPARRSSGCTSPTSPRSRSRTARPCRSAVPRPSSTSTSSATSPRHADRGSRRRNSSTTSSSSCAWSGSCALRSTTSCSPATRPGSPRPSAASAMTDGRW